MRYKEITIYTFIGLFILVGCRYDKVDYLNDQQSICNRYLPTPNSSLLSVMLKPRFEYTSPFFNPSNPNEFLYYLKDNELSIYKLMKYNLAYGLKSEITGDFRLTSAAKWNIDGWICFSSYPDAKLWKIKDDQDSTILLTNEIPNGNPTWSEDKIIVLRTENGGVPYYTISINENILENDTIFEGWATNHQTSLENGLLIAGSESIEFTDANDIWFETVVDFGTYDIPLIRGIAWHPNSEDFYFTTNNKCYKSNIYTKELQVVFPFCDGVSYTNISCSSDGKKLVGERVFVYPKITNGVYHGTLIQESSIAYVDLETMEETIIEL